MLHILLPALQHTHRLYFLLSLKDHPLRILLFHRCYNSLSYYNILLNLPGLPIL